MLTGMMSVDETAARRKLGIFGGMLMLARKLILLLAVNAALAGCGAIVATQVANAYRDFPNDCSYRAQIPSESVTIERNSQIPFMSSISATAQFSSGEAGILCICKTNGALSSQEFDRIVSAMSQNVIYSYAVNVAHTLTYDNITRSINEFGHQVIEGSGIIRQKSNGQETAFSSRAKFIHSNRCLQAFVATTNPYGREIGDNFIASIFNTRQISAISSVRSRDSDVNRLVERPLSISPTLMNPSVETRLQELRRIRDQNLITQSEYESSRSRIIQGL